MQIVYLISANSYEETETNLHFKHVHLGAQQLQQNQRGKFLKVSYTKWITSRRASLQVVYYINISARE